MQVFDITLNIQKGLHGRKKQFSVFLRLVHCASSHDAGSGEGGRGGEGGGFAGMDSIRGGGDAAEVRSGEERRGRWEGKGGGVSSVLI